MKKFKLILLTSLLCLSSQYAFSDAYTANPEGTTEASDDTLTKYVKTLGEYLGYDLETAIAPDDSMLDPTYNIALTGLQIINSFFATIPVNSAYQSFTTNSDYKSINDQANATFTNYHSPNGADVSVTPNFDQPTSQDSTSSYQNDPVSQAIYNLIATPDAKTCSSDDNSSIKCLNQNEVMKTVLQDMADKNGNLPGETLYFTPDYVSKFASQLNVNTLIAPLIYSTTESGSTSSNGLPATNQEQQAAEFIRYATAAVLPIDTMSESDYSALWTQAKQSKDGADAATIDSINDAQKELNSYLLGLRVYAAQSSVAISNLYSILARRMPQTSTSSDGKSNTTTSQAFNEFQEATWRLYNPAEPSTDKQWYNLINNSSSATIQKEVAILLSEINYQLYLNRQQQERILLTNSLQLIQLMVNNKPNTAPLNGGSTAVPATS